MKKLLVLSLVLGMASLASAGFSFNGTTDVHAAGGESYSGLWIIVQGATVDLSGASLWGDGAVSQYSVADPTTLADYAAILAADFGMPGVTDIIEFELIDSSDPFDPVPSGKVLSGIGFGGVGTLTLSTLELEVLDSVVVPEPATMALLGLGALVLRRKK